MATRRFNYLQRFRVALRDIGYTKAEANEIVAKIRKNKDNDGCFERACEQDYEFSELIDCLFIWELSPEGYIYWDALHTRLVIWENGNAETYL